MGVIKNLLQKIEDLKNQFKILEGKLNNLKINVDTVNSKTKELPDRNVYKPQQPYALDAEKILHEIGTEVVLEDEIIEFDKIREAEGVPTDIDVVIEDGILKFTNRPPYAIYYPDEE